MHLKLLLFCLIFAATPVWAGNRHHPDKVDRIIVKYKQAENQSGQTIQRDTTIPHAKGVLRLSRLRTGNYADIYNLDKTLTAAEARSVAQELMQRGDVEYAEPDYRRYPAMVPNDTGYLQQWYLQRSALEAGAVNAEEAWDDTTGDSSIVVAVIDTGILRHEDIAGGRVLSSAGYDFISDPIMANDGSGRDSDPTDAGDFVTAVEARTPAFKDCDVQPSSSWHGTLVSGVLIATAGNLQGIAGVDHEAMLLPLRVLGKCGGSSFDIADAIRWAAGLPVPGTPLNDNPADVINLSLGGEDPCSITEQSAIDAAVAAGAVVVAAAGNDERTEIGSPASCNHVIAVAATSRQGAETCYTNVGINVDIGAPGGNDSAGICHGNDFIITTGNDGTTVADDDIYKSVLGTSFATPLVSGAAALVKAIDGDLSPDAIEGVLETTARAFPKNTSDGFGDCTTDRCGAGILDIHGAVSMAITGVDAIANPFQFKDRINVEIGTTIVSNSVKITGINVSLPVRVSGEGEYSIDGGPFTDAEGSIDPNQSIQLRLRSAGSPGAKAETRLSIGEVNDTFTVVTRGKSGGGGGEAAWLMPLLIAPWKRSRHQSKQ